MTPLSENAMRVLQSRYLRKRSNGSSLETPDEMFRRVAKAVTRAELTWGGVWEAEQWEEVFYKAMNELLFLPNSPTLMNAGTLMNQLSACFVLPIEDNLENIFDTLKCAALIQQSGGGTGFNFSNLRPKNAYVTKTSGTASGPVSFIKIFDAATEHVKQGGKRRGANMGVLSITHPDIEEFITSKRYDGTLKNFNLSVGITDDFMKAVENDQLWQLTHPFSAREDKKIAARALWDLIAQCAWESGDPGLLFLDTINKYNPTPSLGRIESTNPCGEVPLLPYESCTLGSLNLSKFITTTKYSAEFNWTLLAQTVKTAIRFLDDCVEINHYSMPEIKAMAFGNRKIGLGVMGWADALGMLSIPYDSMQAVELAEQLMQFIQQHSHETSQQLALERGTFGNWKKSMYAPHQPIRNATCTSIAPTGSISIIANTSASIEPWFALAYQRKHVLNDEILPEINSVLKDHFRIHYPDADAILEEVLLSGTLQDLALPPETKIIFKTTIEIEPIWHIRHQAAFQQYTDNAISKTINLPETCSIADIKELYWTAWTKRLKGVTIFRDNCKASPVWRGIDTSTKVCKVCTG